MKVLDLIDIFEDSSFVREVSHVKSSNSQNTISYLNKLDSDVVVNGDIVSNVNRVCFVHFNNLFYLYFVSISDNVVSHLKFDCASIFELEL